MIFEVPVKDLDLGRLFVELDQNKEKIGIKEYGIAQTSLEDVFLTIVGDNESE